VGITLSYRLCGVNRSKNSMPVRTGDRLASMYLKAPSVKTRTPTKRRPMNVKSRCLSENEISNELSNIGSQEEYFSHRLHLNTHAVQSASVYHFPPSRSGSRTDRHHATFKGRSCKTIIAALVFSVPAVSDSDAIQTIDSYKKLSREASSALTSSLPDKRLRRVSCIPTCKTRRDRRVRGQL